MAIKVLKERGSSASSIGRTLGVTEGAVRYHLRRQAAHAVDGRGGKVHKAAGLHEAITTWLAGQSGVVNLAALHAWLVEEHGYDGSPRSVQRWIVAAQTEVIDQLRSTLGSRLEITGSQLESLMGAMETELVIALRQFFKEKDPGH